MRRTLLFSLLTLACLPGCSGLQGSSSTGGSATSAAGTASGDPLLGLFQDLSTSLDRSAGRQQALRAGLREPRGLRGLRGLRGPETIQARHQQRALSPTRGLRAPAAVASGSALDQALRGRTAAGPGLPGSGTTPLSASSLQLRYDPTRDRIQLFSSEAGRYGSTPSTAPVHYDPVSGTWTFH